MAKRYKIILSVLLVILIGVAAVVVSGVLDINKRVDGTHQGTVVPTSDGEYTDLFATDTSAALPLMKTKFDNVYFTMSKSGEVTFYEVAAGKITAIAETGNYEVTAECSNQKLTAVIHYLERDGETDGYGLFTNILHPDVLLYDYAFFRVTDMFDNFDDDGELLMMLDIDSSRFYSDEKVYSEIFRLYSDHTSKYFLSENQRTIDILAREKTDYKMFTDDISDQGSAKNVLFFSSRNYVSYETSDMVDIFTSGGSGNNVDNVRYIADVATLNFWRVDGKTYYLSMNDEADDSTGESSFSLKAYDGSNSTVIGTFSGDPDEDYLICGEYMLNRLTGEIYNVLTSESKTFSLDSFDGYFAPDMFKISENGKYCVIRGSSNGVASCGVANLETGAVYVYSDDVFGYIANMQVLDDGTVIVSTANGDSGSAFYQLIANVQ